MTTGERRREIAPPSVVHQQPCGYSALISVEEAERRGATAIDVRMDSLLVVQQMRGLWRVKHPGLVPLALRAGALLASFKQREIRHVPREQNAAADELSNRAIDEGEIKA